MHQPRRFPSAALAALIDELSAQSGKIFTPEDTSALIGLARLRPRPTGSYGIASERALLGDRAPTVALFHAPLANFANDRDM